MALISNHLLNMKIVILVDREKFIHDFFKLILVEFEVKFYSFFELSNNLYMIKVGQVS